MPGPIQIKYMSRIPEGSVPICHVSAKPDSPADLIDVYNFEQTGDLAPGLLTVRHYPAGQSWTANSLYVPLRISGTQLYVVENQFFELTWKTSVSGQPLFYYHPLSGESVDSATIVDGAGREHGNFTVENGRLYHSMDAGPYWVKYSSGGLIYRKLLRYRPVMERGRTLDDHTYTLSLAGVLGVNRVTNYWIRFTEHNGWKVLPPYSTPLTDPWWVRVRFNLRRVPPEYAVQPYVPYRPYRPASWVPGRVLEGRIIEFERKEMFFEGAMYPDVLIYSASGEFKHALSGLPEGTRVDRGHLFRWRTHQFAGIDEKHARVEVLVDLKPDDLAYGFYFYREPDLLFQDLDVNPYTNHSVRNRIIEFYYGRRAE